jgi:Domain of unknown function (DUF397)
MGDPNLSQAIWRRSGTCESNTCIEVAVIGRCIGIRDSADTATRTILLFSQKDWLFFISRMHAGAT